MARQRNSEPQARSETEGVKRLLLGICVATGFTTLLDQSVFGLVVARLRDGLHASTAGVQLIVAIYSVAFGVALVPAGRLGDIIGRRRLFLFGLAMFSGFSLLGGLADTAHTVIVARLLQGLGAGIINTQVLGLIQDLFHGHPRARALGLYAAAGGLSGLAGPLLGGAILAWASPDLGWRLLFLVNVPFGLAVFVLGWRHLPRGRLQSGRFSLDAGGLILLAILTLALMGATLVGTDLPISSRACLAVALASLALLVAWERRYARRGGSPIFAPGLIGSPGYVLGTCVAMCQFASGLTLGMISTLFFLNGIGISALMFACLSVSSALGMILSSRQSWRFVGRFGRPGIVLAIACYALLALLQGVSVATLPVHGIVLLYPLIGLLQGLSSGLIHAPNQALTLAAAGDTEGRGLAAGFLQLSQRLACSVGMSWGTGVFLAGMAGGAGFAGARSAFIRALHLVLVFSCGALLAALADARRRRVADTEPAGGYYVAEADIEGS